MKKPRFGRPPGAAPALCLWTGICVFAAINVTASVKDDIGHTQLASELGGSLPTGTGITATQVEAPQAGNHMPDKSHAEFAGKTLTNRSGPPTNASTHATGVGRRYYGNATSIAPSINTVDNYETGNWVGAGALRVGPPNLDPLVETNDVQNHSWVGSSSEAVAANRAIDFVVRRDGVSVVVGLGNTATPLPDLLGQNYNGITVGRTNGIHSSGTTTLDGSGRTKPDIVAPASQSSFAVPIVSGAAAMLLETATTNPVLTNAVKPECIKAILLAGATKEKCYSWDRTHARPLDETYGAGRLNIYNSYFILAAGEQKAGGATNVADIGWDFGSVTATTTSRYFFAVDSSNVMTRLSAILTWNRIITDNDPGVLFDPIPITNNLSLRLYTASNYVPITCIDWSTSSVDNVEHVYQKGLYGGQYLLEVAGDSSADYALAWHSSTVLAPKTVTAGMTNNNFRFGTSVSTGYTYVTEVATNLVALSNIWSAIATNVSASNVLFYTDTDASNYMLRYYRLRLED
jgi:hypothetical protein